MGWNKFKLIRDRVGKPIFYCQNSGHFAFSSEIKSFNDVSYSEVDLCRILEFHLMIYSFLNIKSVKPK